LTQVEQERRRHERNVQKMREEVKRAAGQEPDTKPLKDVVATVGGQRSDAYRARPPLIQALIDHFEDWTAPHNWLDAPWYNANYEIKNGRMPPRAQFEMQIWRATKFIEGY
jgi:hypothetical protein